MSAVLAPTAELRRLRISEARKLTIGGRIRWARARRKLSHDDLASRIGSSRSYLIRIEKGIHTPSLEFRKRIAAATDTPEDFFSADDDDEESDPVRDLVHALRRVIAEAEA